MIPGLNYKTDKDFRYCNWRVIRQSGFTYIALLIAVAIMGALLAQVATFRQQVVQRQKERELLAVGDEYRSAITRYYADGGGAQHSCLSKFEDLLEDKRVPFVRRYLRKLYFDPITGSRYWGIVKESGDCIVGVYSLSEQAPVKMENFGQGDVGFKGRKHYSEWRFVYDERSLSASGVQPGQ